jgi:hypothetical protein
MGGTLDCITREKFALPGYPLGFDSRVTKEGLSYRQIYRIFIYMLMKETPPHYEALRKDERGVYEGIVCIFIG